jgi:hypothetical protein
MDSFLRLTFTSDDDGTGELHAQVSCNGFSGRSRAWFSLPQLETFAAEILRFPLPLEGTTSLRGGYWSRERKGELEQLHLSLRLYPVGPLGVVGCAIALRTPLQRSTNNQAADAPAEVQVELRTSYQQVAEFSAALRRLARSEATEAILAGLKL